MGLWGVLIEVLKTAATHAAPHVARSAVDMARERMGTGADGRRTESPAEELKDILLNLDQRLASAEERASSAEEQMAALRDELERKSASARIWVIALLAWNAAVTAVMIYLIVRRR